MRHAPPTRLPERKSIIFLTGLRRIGKTTLLKLLVQKLITSGTKPQCICYISLDDYSFEKFSILDLISEFRKIHKLTSAEHVYLFLDEVAYKDKFQQQLKTIHDRQNAKVFAASSSSSLLKDKKAFLTGRAVIKEISPLDFDEFLQFKGITIKQSDSGLKEPEFKS